VAKDFRQEALPRASRDESATSSASEFVRTSRNTKYGTCRRAAGAAAVVGPSRAHRNIPQSPAVGGAPGHVEVLTSPSDRPGSSCRRRRLALIDDVSARRVRGLRMLLPGQREHPVPGEDQTKISPAGPAPTISTGGLNVSAIRDEIPRRASGYETESIWPPRPPIGRQARNGWLWRRHRLKHDTRARSTFNDI
jgi:hypothetical protein